MISRHISSIPKEHVFLHNCSRVIGGAPRLVVSASSLVAGAPRCPKVHLKATPLVQSTLEFDHPGILVRQLSDIPTGSRWHNYILLMDKLWISDLLIDNVPGAPPPEDTPNEEAIDPQQPDLTCIPDPTKTKANR